MKKLIIIGAGGYFRELYEYISSDLKHGYLKSIAIKGVLDDKVPDSELPIPYLGSIFDYKLCIDDIFIIAIGNVAQRKKIYESLKEIGASFFSYTHSTALISTSAKIGEGVIICPFTIINANATISDNVSINVNVSIGHEARVGKHSVISPYSALNGAASVDDMVFLGTRVTVFPKISVGKQVVVDSHTAVRKNVLDKHMVTEKVTYTSVLNRFLR